MKKILITGGMGYLGGRIASYLSENPELILKITTRRKIQDISAQTGNIQVMNLDLMSDHDLDRACRGIEYVIHLAAVNEIESLTNPEDAFNINSLGTLKLLRSAERAGVKRFIYISTAHVYGTPLEGILCEETVARPTHPYAITHKAAEDFVLAAHSTKKMIGIVLRLSNAFGKPVSADIDRWTLLVNDLCRQAIVNKNIVLRSSGMQKRDFITISDVTRSILHFLCLPKKNCLDGLFNLGGECVLRITEMAELISARCREVLDFSPEISVKPEQIEDIAGEFQYSIEKLKSTGFDLHGDINDEIDDTLRFCHDNFSA